MMQEDDRQYIVVYPSPSISAWIPVKESDVEPPERFGFIPNLRYCGDFEDFEDKLLSFTEASSRLNTYTFHCIIAKVSFWEKGIILSDTDNLFFH